MTSATPPPTIFDIANLQNMQTWADPALAHLEKQRQERLEQEEFQRRAQMTFMQQAKQFAQQDQLQRAEQMFRSIENANDRKFRTNQDAREKSFRTQESDKDRQAAEARAEAQTAAYFRRDDAATQKATRLKLLDEYGALPAEGESFEAFIARAQKERQNRTESNLGSLRGQIDHLTVNLERAAQEIETELTQRIDAKARNMAATRLAIPLHQFDPLKNPKHKAAFTSEIEFLASSEKPNPALIARFKALERELSASTGLMDNVFVDLRRHGGDLGAMFRSPDAMTQPAPPKIAAPLPPAPAEAIRVPGVFSPVPNAPSAAASPKFLDKPFQKFKSFAETLPPEEKQRAYQAAFDKIGETLGIHPAGINEPLGGPGFEPRGGRPLGMGLGIMARDLIYRPFRSVVETPGGTPAHATRAAATEKLIFSNPDVLRAYQTMPEEARAAAYQRALNELRPEMFAAPIPGPSLYE